MAKQDPDAIMIAAALQGDLKKLPTECIVCDTPLVISSVNEFSRTDDERTIILRTTCEKCDTQYYIKYSAIIELYSHKGDRVWDLIKWSINPDDLLEENESTIHTRSTI